MTFVGLLAIVTGLLVGAGQVAADPVHTAVRESLVPGVEHLAVSDGDLSAHVAEIAPTSGYELHVALAGDQVGGGLERTSVLCRRAGCLAAVNGDFRLPGTNMPVGGVVRDGVVLRSPSATHHQLVITEDGDLDAGVMRLEGRLVRSDLQHVVFDGVNTERREDEAVLFTPAFGRSTGTNAFGVEVVLRIVEPRGLMRLDQTVLVEAERFVDRQGNLEIPEDGLVLSGHGERTRDLLALRDAISTGKVSSRMLLRVESTPEARHALGGSPVLLRDGRVWVGEERSSFVSGRHPRTVVGWNDDGKVWLVAIDGRQPGHSRGASLVEAAQFVKKLGATHALNLDGGGTTTFVVDGRVVNQPSDRLVERRGERRIVAVADADDKVLGSVERPTTTALVLVPRDGSGSPAPDPLLSGELGLPTALDLPFPAGTDPASVPGGDLPALVAVSPTGRTDAPLVAAAVVALAVASLLLGGARVHRHHRR